MGDGANNAPDDYPGNPLRGNDDEKVPFDEDSYPYAAGKGAVGQLIAMDEPVPGVSDALNATGLAPGSDGDRFHYKLWSRDFARLQIGSK